MTLDLAPVGSLAAELMEKLEHEIETGDLPEDTAIGAVMIVVEYRAESDRTTGVRYLCSDERGWVQRGLLHEALTLDEVVEDE